MVLSLSLSLSLMYGCSFDRTFFPTDETPGDSAEENREGVWLEAADGKTIHHTLIRPRGDHKATIFVFHGSGSTVSNWLGSLQPLVEDGFQLFLMEYRGFGHSEGDPGHETVVADAHRAFRYLLEREDVRDRPLLVLGQSYGGQIAINVAATFPADVDALVTEGTFTSFRDMAVYATPWIAKPFTWTVFVNPYSALELIEEASMPKLIIHSQDDETVPFFMGEALYSAARGSKALWKIRGKHTEALADYPREFIVKLNQVAGLAANP